MARAPLIEATRLQEETARVEKNLLDGDFTDSIVRCFNTPKANNFDYNLLEPLQKLLRLSPPVAAGLARFDMYTGILQKLTHKKAVIRLNMLRIVRSICDPNEERGMDITAHPLFSAIEALAAKDTAVLVQNMARELVASAKENMRRHELSAAPNRLRNQARRQSSYQNAISGSSLGELRGLRDSPHTLMGANGRPHTSHLGSLFSGGEHASPRRSGLALGHLGEEAHEGGLLRPRSRDSNASPFGGLRKASSEVARDINGVPIGKSRLPRTSLRPVSRGGVAAASRPQLVVGASSSSSASSGRPESRGNRPESRGNEGRLAVNAGQARVRNDPSKTPITGSGGGGHLFSRRRPRAPSTGVPKWS